jgi:ribose transport system permease protein
MGRHVFAFGGNLEASRFAGLALNRIQIGVYALSGLTAGIAAFLGASFYGSSSSGDAQGYELYVIASAVVGGASLIGGKGSAVGAMLGAVLIVLIRQSIRTLHFDQNYEWIVIGCAIIIAVVVDQWSTRITARRLARAAESVRSVGGDRGGSSGPTGGSSAGDASGLTGHESATMEKS